MKLTPLIIGKGRSGEAIAKSLLNLGVIHPHFELAEPIWLPRGGSLEAVRHSHENPILCVANPHGLHAEIILEADRLEFPLILCEKPACVSIEQVQDLKKVKALTAIFHGYRQMWGPQKLKALLNEGDLGELVTIEGRYWQASAAERALLSESVASKKSWKNDTRLSGEYDVYLDLGTHWLDLLTFLYGHLPSQISGWKSYKNAEASHRDTHIQLEVEFRQQGRAFGSVSKIYHGAGNHLEVNLIGTKKSATWIFSSPDEITLGEGRDRKIITRKDSTLGSRQSPFHGVGWLEGYMEISYQAIERAFFGKSGSFPDLPENLKLLEVMFNAQWKNN